MPHIICSSESRAGAFLYLAHMPRTSLVIHSSCNIRAFLFHSVLVQISIYAASFISSYFCPLNVSTHSIDLLLCTSLLLFFSLIITWDNFHTSCLQHIFVRITAQFWICRRWCNAVIFASMWGKLISLCIHRSNRGFRIPEQHIRASV